jgi:hypothetical protein
MLNRDKNYISYIYNTMCAYITLPDDEEEDYCTEWDIISLGLSLWIVDELTN